MRPFLYQRANGIPQAMQMVTVNSGCPVPPTAAVAQYLAGGTTLLDLMKLDVMRPEVLVDISRLDSAGTRIERRSDGFYLSAFVTMAVAAEHPEITLNYPVIAQSLDLAASSQIRNMATLGGNVLQRTRCSYIFAIRPGGRATSASPGPAAPRSTGSTASTPCSGSVIIASPPIQATSRRRLSRSMPWSKSSGLRAGASSRSSSFTFCQAMHRMSKRFCCPAS
jgi:CO/xanthine dehydrogenase FAD-binding subunit